MDESTKNNHEDRELGPTYRTLFLGACILIGTAFGWWLTNFIATIDYAHRSYESAFRELEKRTALLETGQERTLWERDALKRDIAEFKRRIEK